MSESREVLLEISNPNNLRRRKAGGLCRKTTRAVGGAGGGASTRTTTLIIIRVLFSSCTISTSIILRRENVPQLIKSCNVFPLRFQGAVCESLSTPQLDFLNGT